MSLAPINKKWIWPFALSLSKGSGSPRDALAKQGFDKLSQNGPYG
jgi:hypothetical protein